MQKIMSLRVSMGVLLLQYKDHTYLLTERSEKQTNLTNENSLISKLITGPISL
jgi:hypothetical protein